MQDKKIHILMWKKSDIDIDYNYIKNTESFYEEDLYVDKKEFVNIYKDYYFIPDNKEDGTKFGKTKDENCPKSIIQSPSWIEKEIMSIMGREWKKEDVYKILAWKTGNIDYTESINKKEIKYKTGWAIDSFSISLRKSKMLNGEFKDFANFVAEQNNSVIYETDKKPEQIWRNIINYVQDHPNNAVGIGPVYLITFLFFITQGEYPIYDRFAMAALLSFELNCDKFNLIPDHTRMKIGYLPDKNSKAISNLLSDDNNIYAEYLKLLNKYFGDDWKADKKKTLEEVRNIDRALWVYGHYFRPE